MKISIRKAIAAGSAVALTAALLSVAGTSSATAASASPVTGGTLEFYTNGEQFANLDPQRNYTGQHLAFTSAYFMRTVVSYTPTAGKDGFTLIPDLATNTGVPSNKAKTWKYTLRDGVTWEDGSAVTCEDLKYGMSRTFATELFVEGPAYPIQWLDIPGSGGESSYKGPYVKTGQDLYDKAVTCSGNTITYNLKKSVPDFNYYMTYQASGPVKKSKDTGDKYDLHPLATGPYKISKYEINDEFVLVRNPEWNKSSDFRTPYPDKIVVTFNVAEDLRDEITLKDSKPNAVNLDGLAPANNIKAMEDPKMADRRWNLFDPYVSYVTANNAPGHLDCLLVRKAIFFAYPAQALIDLNGGTKYYGEPGDGIIKPNLGLDYAPTTGNIHDKNYKIEGNPEYAKQLLNDAKKVCPATVKRVTDPKKGISYYRTDTATSKKVATIVGDGLKKAGFVVNVSYKPSGTWNANLEKYKAETDLFGSGWGPDWANASTVVPEMWGQGCCNYTSNMKATGAQAASYKLFISNVNKALNELDRNKQASMWKKLNQFGMDQYWYVYTAFTKTQDYWGSKVGGVDFWDPQGTWIFGNLYVKK